MICDNTIAQRTTTTRLQRLARQPQRKGKNMTENALPVPAAQEHRGRITMPKRARCRECGRVFDLTDESDADEWYRGHDCEA